MVARRPLVHDRRLPTRGVGLDHAGPEREARLIHQNKGPVLAAGLLLQNRPRLDPPAWDRLLITLDCPGDRDLRGPAQTLEQTRDLALAGGDAELLREDAGDPLTGPDVAPKTVGLGAVPEEIGDETELLGGQLGFRPRTRVSQQRLRTIAAGGGQPLTDRPPRDPESGCD